MFDSVRPHRRQPTRLLCLWDSSGKNTRVGCHFLLPCMHAYMLSRFSVMSDSVQPYGQQPTRLLCLWDSLGKNTGVGCHFLLQCMKVKSESEVAPSCPTLSDPTNCSSPGSSVRGIFQARVLKWGAIAFSILLALHI